MPAAAQTSTAPLDTRQLLLPSLQALAQDLVQMLPVTAGIAAAQVEHMLVQMGHAAHVLELNGLQQLLRAMGQALPQSLAHAALPSDTEEHKAADLLQWAARDAQHYIGQLCLAQTPPNQTLFASYRALTKLNAKDIAHPADLWDSPWSQDIAWLAPAGTEALIPSVELRSVLDQHVLALLQHSDLTACATLRDTSLGLAAYAPHLGVWQLSAAWMQALEQGLLPLDLYAKRLASRLLSYYASFAKDRPQLPPSLLRDLQFFCAQACECAQQRSMACPDLLLQVQQQCAPQTLPHDDAPASAPKQTASPHQHTPPPLAPALPAFESATEIDTQTSLGQGLASTGTIAPDLAFLDEAQTLCDALHQSISTWRAQPQATLHADAAGLAHQLSRQSWTAGCTEIASLSHALHRCLHRMPENASAEQRLCCQHASDEIQRLLHQFAAGFLRRPHPQVVDALQQLFAQLPAPAAEPAQTDAPATLAVATHEAAQDPTDAIPAPAHTGPVALDPLHFAVFEEEVLSVWPKLHNALQQWLHTSGDNGARQTLLRSLHTLKGSARLAGALPWASQVHALESLALELPATPNAQPAQLQAPLEALRLAFVALQQEMAERHPGREHHATHNPLDTVQRHAQALWSTHAASCQAHTASEIALQAMNTSLHKLRTHIQDCAAWADTLVLHGGLDLPYEWHEELQALVQALQLCNDDATTVQAQLQHHASDSNTALSAQGGHLRALQHTLLYARLLPLQHWHDRLQHCVQLAAQDAGKSVQLQLQGSDQVLDRHTAQTLLPALEHLLRNCVAHGVEHLDARVQAGKVPAGQLRLSVHTEGATQVVSLQDDGPGLDVTAIAHKARTLGLVGQDEDIDHERAAQLILHPGLSTAATATELAGRGIGMDAVADTIHQLGGQLHINSQSGQGCCFTLRLPAPAHIEQVLPIRAGHWHVALPARSVESVRSLPAAQLDAALARGVLQHDSAGPLPLYWAGAVWQQCSHSQQAPVHGMRHVLVVRSDTARWGMVVDEVLPTQEVGLQLHSDLQTPIAGLLGMATQASGQVVQVYEPVATLRAHEARLLNQRSSQAPKGDNTTLKDTAASTPLPLVLLADDSLSVRRLGQHLLQSHGLRVQTAEDGLQALQLLQHGELPALVIADIEMPNLDGLELLRRLRTDSRWQHLPVVMLTAHSAGPLSHQAMDLGAQAFLTKPYTPNELLALAHRFTQPQLTATAQ